MTVSLPDGIDWVGAVDGVRDFHSYDTNRGTTYNAYLVRDEKTALIDTVKAPFAGELLRNVAALANRRGWITSSATTPSWTTRGALPRGDPGDAPGHAGVRQEMRRRAGRAFRHLRLEDPDRRQRRDRSRSAGGRCGSSRRRWSIGPSRWPPTCPRRSCCSRWTPSASTTPPAERFDDEADLPPCSCDEAKTYYANIVMPYGRAVLKALERLGRSWRSAMIAPSHGLIWRRHAAEIVAAYRDWANHRPAAEGAGDLRHDVGEHRGHGRGD